MMKQRLKIYTVMVALGMSVQSAVADKLPHEAQREVDQLKKFVKEKTLETEKRILRKKQDAIRALERYEKTIKSELAKNLIKLQLVKYRKQVEESEALIHGKHKGKEEKRKDRDHAELREASRIIDFRVSYFYVHPVEQYKHQKGEFQFFKNGGVHCTHRTGEKVEMHKKWSWHMKDGKIMIKADGFHGPIYVTRKSPTEIYLDWKGVVNKKNVAKQN